MAERRVDVTVYLTSKVGGFEQLAVQCREFPKVTAKLTPTPSSWLDKGRMFHGKIRIVDLKSGTYTLVVHPEPAGRTIAVKRLQVFDPSEASSSKIEV